MAQFDEKVALFRRYAKSIMRDFEVYVKGEIPVKKIDNAIKAYAYSFGIDRSTIIGLCDTTILGSGKKGAIFTDKKVYVKDSFEDARCFRYSEIVSMDDRQNLVIECESGSPIEFPGEFYHANELKAFLEEMMKLVKND